MKSLTHLGLALSLVAMGCSDNSPSTSEGEPRLIIRLQFNPDQERLNNLGEPAELPEGNAAQSPHMKQMSAHYIELAPTRSTGLGEGAIIYQGDETTLGGEPAIHFEEAFLTGDNGVLLNVPLNKLSPGTYNWVRVSLSYQEGDIMLRSNGEDHMGTLASFVGYNTYINTLNLNSEKLDINANKPQGFWAFETAGYTVTGQAPQGATTVPNPLFNSSPIPEGSCVVTGAFAVPFEVTGNETKDITINLSFSINQSFEWKEVIFDGKYEPSIGEQVVDMGLRGLVPSASN